MIQFSMTSQVILKRLQEYQLNTDKTDKTGTNRCPPQRFYRFFQPSDAETVKKYRHLVCVNLNVPPASLYLTTIDGQRMAFLIERKSNVTRINLHLDATLFNETVLEGELIKNEFLISDLLVENGKLANTRSLTYKLSYLRSLIDNRYSPETVDRFRLVLKDYVEPTALRVFYRQMSEKYSVKGLIFRPVAKSQKNLILTLEQAELLGAGSAPNNSEAKMPTESIAHDGLEETFFVVADQVKPDVYFLYRNSDGSLSASNSFENLKPLIATVTTMENSLRLQKIFANPESPIPVGLYFKCRFVERFKRWEPIVLCE